MPKAVQIKTEISWFFELPIKIEVEEDTAGPGSASASSNCLNQDWTIVADPSDVAEAAADPMDVAEAADASGTVVAEDTLLWHPLPKKLLQLHLQPAREMGGDPASVTNTRSHDACHKKE